MKLLITSDLHLSDRPRDAHRFGLFKWLAKQQSGYDALLILGDITDNKDRHSATLVNHIIEGVLQLKPPIYILKGNHDYVSSDNPFFRFLNCIEGLTFISEPKFLKGLGVAAVPHCQTEDQFAKACGAMPTRPAVFVAHQLITGAKAETGQRLTGFSASPIESLKPRAGYLGDVHRPQRVGNCVTYVGSPYHVRFGDNFTPRVLLVTNGTEQDLHFPAPRKWSLTISDAEDLLTNSDLHSGDQVKLTVELVREEVVEWPSYKRRIVDACKELGLEFHGIDLKVNTPKKGKINHTRISTPEATVRQFCLNESVGSAIREAGLELLK